MRPFSLLQPKDVAEACAKAGPKTAFKAAGIDLLDRMKERVESPELVIDLGRLREQLATFDVTADRVTLGALVTLAQIAGAEPFAARAFTALREAAGEAATPQVRNRATLGGNLLQKARCWYLRGAEFGCKHDGRADSCRAMEGENRYHAILGWHDCVRVHPSNLAPALLLYEPELVVARGAERRTLPLRELWPQQPTAERPEHQLGPDEVLTQVRFAIPRGDTRTAYRESREKLSFDWATTAAAVRVTLDGGRIADARIVLGAVAPVPVPADDAARFLTGKEPTEAVLRECAELAFAGARPLAQNDYKVPVGKATLVDALAAATRKE